MKFRPLMKLLPCLPAALLALAGTASADFDPVILTPGSYNHDMIVEKTAPRPFAVGTSTTVSMDGGTANTGFTWYERGFNTANVNSGLPTAGTTITHASDAAKSYAMPSTYAGNCSLFISSQVTTGTLTLTNPAVLTNLSVLSSSGGGAVNMNYTITFADTSTATGTLNSGDWFNGGSPAWTTAGRINPGTGAYDSVGSANPRLYSQDITIVSLSAVSSISFTYTSGGRCSIFALTGGVAGVWTPLAITGFNHDVVVGNGEVSLSPLTTATTASMDTGTTNTGNTWYERTYYPVFPVTGLPPADSTFDSAILTDHHYRMAPDYTVPNTVMVDSATPVQTITLATPTAYSALSFLHAASNAGAAGVTVECTVLYQDSTTEAKTFLAKDWFNATPVAFDCDGRVNLTNRTLNNVNGNNPRLYEEQFTLGNTTSPVVSVSIRWNANGLAAATSRVAVLAVSGTVGPIKPTYGSIPAAAKVFGGTQATFSATISGGNAPITFQWQKDVGGTFTNLTDGGSISGATTLSLTINPAEVTDEGSYRLVATNAAGSTNTPAVTLTVLSSIPDVTAPGDIITAIGGTSPGTEGVEHTIDNVIQKYLNFGVGPNPQANPFVGPVGFIVTPASGASVLKGIRIYTANDTVGRDPVDFAIEGSNDGGANWTLVTAGPLALPADRNGTGNVAINPLTMFLQQILFTNTASYTSYRVTFEDVKDPTGVNSMQIGEMELLGVPPPAELSIARAGSAFQLSSSGPGTLQMSTDLTPWTDVGPINPATPYLFTPGPADFRKFFRMKP